TEVNIVIHDTYRNGSKENIFVDSSRDHNISSNSHHSLQDHHLYSITIVASPFDRYQST
ncbi:3022_t:CDS:1, partial [Cetraspora pellucida]